MKLILDACSAILLAKASVLESLTETHKIFVTKAVYDEVIAGKEKMFPDALLVERLKDEKKISLIEPESSITSKLKADFNMGDGEASTVAIAINDKAAIVATDNLQGRKAAKINGISLVGSPEIIVSLFKKKKITGAKAKEGLKILKEEGWFDPNLIDKALEDVK